MTHLGHSQRVFLFLPWSVPKLTVSTHALSRARTHACTHLLTRMRRFSRSCGDMKANAAEIKAKYGLVLSDSLSKKLGAVKVGLYCSVACILIAAIAGSIGSRKSSKVAAAASVVLLGSAAIATFASVGSFGAAQSFLADDSYVVSSVHAQCPCSVSVLSVRAYVHTHRFGTLANARTCTRVQGSFILCFCNSI